MISFCNYNFCGDKDVLNPFPTNVEDIGNVKIENGIYDHVNISKDTSKDFNTDIPQWDFDTIINADFENGIGGGNVDFTFSQLTAIKIKRRKKSKIQWFRSDEDWITVKEIEVNDKSNLNEVIRDYFVPSFEEFEYALVPILNGIEGRYIIGSVKTEFDGVFICDITNTFKLDKDVSYDGRTSVQQVGQIVPLGRKYPVIIKNGEADYDIGTISGMLLGKNYDENHIIDRKNIVDEVDSFKSFLKNGKPKIIKDLINRSRL